MILVLGVKLKTLNHFSRFPKLEIEKFQSLSERVFHELRDKEKKDTCKFKDIVPIEFGLI